jgi:Spy/CpxP family protein refolding chaperone
MKRYTKALWAGSLAVLLIVGAVAVGNGQNLRRLQQERGGAAALRGMFGARMFLAGLDLTDPQKEQVKTIFANHKADIKAVVQDTIQARKGLREALAAGADSVALKTAYDKVSDAGWKALQLLTQIGAEIKPILTAEQQAKLQKRLQNMKKLGMQMIEKRRNKKVDE